MFNLLLSIIKNLFFVALHITKSGAFPPPLSAKKEAELLARYTEGDNSARDILIEHNLRLVMHIVKKYYSKAGDQDDLISIGTIGLIKGVSTFKPDKGSRLATYAARCIENEILMYFRSLKKNEKDVYISDPIDTDKDGNALTYGDILTESEDVVDKIDTKIKIDKLSTLIHDVLDERETQIITYRYGLYGKKELTQHEISKKLGISRSYVSRIEKAALAKLRERF